MQSRAITWEQPSGWLADPFQQWRLLRATEEGTWTALTPWLLAADREVRGLHRPVMLWEVTPGAGYDVAFEDRGGIGGGTFLWMDGVRRDASGGWTVAGGWPRLRSPKQPCD